MIAALIVSFDALVSDHAAYLMKAMESVVLKFVIARESKPLIRERLEQMGIDFTHLYPDITGLGKYWSDQKARTYQNWGKRFVEMDSDNK